MASPTPFQVGDRVRVERDETRFPARGSWAQFRGRVGFVASIKVEPSGYTEVGVAWVNAHNANAADSWFLPHELTRLDDA